MFWTFIGFIIGFAVVLLIGGPPWGALIGGWVLATLWHVQLRDD